MLSALSLCVTFSLAISLCICVRACVCFSGCAGCVFLRVAQGSFFGLKVNPQDSINLQDFMVIIVYILQPKVQIGQPGWNVLHFHHILSLPATQLLFLSSTQTFPVWTAILKSPQQGLGIFLCPQHWPQCYSGCFVSVLLFAAPPEQGSYLIHLHIF